jgi:hypothetical protein
MTSDTLGQTLDPHRINEAVYGNDVIAWSQVCQNPRITEARCRELIAKDRDERDRAFLIAHLSFPTDLLEELSLNDRHAFGYPNLA